MSRTVLNLPAELLLFTCEQFVLSDDLVTLARVSHELNAIVMRVLLQPRHSVLHVGDSPDRVQLLTSALCLDMSGGNGNFKSLVYKCTRPMQDTRLLRELTHLKLALTWRANRPIPPLDRITLDLTLANSILLGIIPNDVTDAMQCLLDIATKCTSAMRVTEGRLLDDIQPSISEDGVLFGRAAHHRRHPGSGSHTQVDNDYHDTAQDWWCFDTHRISRISTFFRSCFSTVNRRAGVAHEEVGREDQRLVAPSFSRHTSAPQTFGLKFLTIQSPTLLDDPLQAWTFQHLNSSTMSAARYDSLTALSLHSLDISTFTWSRILSQIHLSNLTRFAIRSSPSSAKVFWRDVLAFLSRHRTISHLSLVMPVEADRYGTALHEEGVAQSQNHLSHGPPPQHQLTTLFATPEVILRLLSPYPSVFPSLSNVVICVDLADPRKRQFRFVDLERQLEDVRGQLGHPTAHIDVGLRVYVPNTTSLDWMDLPLNVWPVGQRSSVDLQAHSLTVPPKIRKNKRHIMLPVATGSSTHTSQTHTSTTGADANSGRASTSTSTHVHPRRSSPTANTQSNRGHNIFATHPAVGSTSPRRSSSLVKLSSDQLNPNRGSILPRVLSVQLVFATGSATDETDPSSNRSPATAMRTGGINPNLWTALPRWLALFPELQNVNVSIAAGGDTSGDLADTPATKEFGREVGKRCGTVKSVKVNGQDVLGL